MRSFLFSERVHLEAANGISGSDCSTPPADREVKQKNNAGFFASWFTEHFDKIRFHTQDKPKVWETAHYLRSLASSEVATHSDRLAALPTLRRKLAVDIPSLFDEHVAQQATIVYPYNQNGIRNGYTESMSQIAQNHVEYLRERKMGTERAVQEVAVARAIEHWMADTESPHRYLISISPRGNVNEGYPGQDPKKSYALINIYERDNDCTFLFRQYRSYDLNEDLPALQQTLSANCAATTNELSFTNPQHPELPTISRLLLIPEHISLDEIITPIYTNQEHWEVNMKKELPELRRDQYDEQRNLLVEFCLQEFATFIENEQLSTTEISKLFDELIATTITTFAKWVDDHALNYEHASSEPYSVDLGQLQQVWETKQKKVRGSSLSDSDKSILETFVSATQLASGSPLGRLMSMAHCVTGTPFSILMKPDLLNALQLNQLTHAQLIELIGKERADKWQLGDCDQCPAKNVMVGECGWCMQCEDGFGRQNSFNQQVENLESYLTQAVSTEQKAEAQQLYRTLVKQFLKSSITLQDFLLADYLDSSATVDPAFSAFAEQLYSSSNPLHTLREIQKSALQSNTAKSIQKSPVTTIFQSKMKRNEKSIFTSATRAAA